MAGMMPVVVCSLIVCAERTLRDDVSAEVNVAEGGAVALELAGLPSNLSTLNLERTRAVLHDYAPLC
jgi:hypothetical protein